MNVSEWTTELMTYIMSHVNEWVPNLKWLKDSLVNVWRGHKGWSLHVLPREVLRMTLVREDSWCNGHDLSLR